MKVVVGVGADEVFTRLSADEQRLVSAWLEHLANWEQNDSVRNLAKRIPGDDNLYVLRNVLRTPAEIRLLFRVESDTITILDIVRRDPLSRLLDSLDTARDEP